LKFRGRRNYNASLMVFTTQRGICHEKIYLALIASAGLLTITTTPAFASDEGWYVYGAVGQLTGNNDKATMDNALIAAGGTGFASSNEQANRL